MKYIRRVALTCTFQLLIAFSATARPFICPSLDEEPSIKFNILSPTTAYDYSLSVAEITKKAHGVHGAASIAGRILGLTHGQARFQIGGGYRARGHAETGTVCT